jgi:hypothetical protein
MPREDFETSNAREIDSLNQRGGRTLSLVDLIEAGTIPPDLAAAAAFAVSRGASLLTAALRGGAGKTTLMAALLMFLPPGERVVTTADARTIADLAHAPADPPVCALAHEIGSGAWYGYIWGRAVPAWFGLLGRGARLASCLHADTLEELRAVITGELAVPPETLDRIGLILFMRAFHGGLRARRRVTSAWFGSADGHVPVCDYDPGRDAFRGAAPEQLAPALRPVTGLDAGENLAGIRRTRAFLDAMAGAGVRDADQIRRHWLAQSPTAQENPTT